MRKDEFLQILRRALNGDVPPGVIEENIRYYDNYITEEVRKGRSEEDVIQEIGDPRLIAKNIEDTTEGAGDDLYQESYSYEDAGSQRTYEQQQTSGGRGTVHYFDLNKWYWKLLVAVIVFAVLYLVFAVVGGLFMLVRPLLVPLLIIWLAAAIWKSGGRR